MAKDVIMPALGMAQETGTLLRWLKAPGDAVVKGEPLMEIETDKATVEVEAPASGVLANVTARPNDVIPVGQPIALILAPGESAPAPSVAPAPPEVASPAPLTASPVAARMAAEHGLALEQIRPEGGRVQKEDVLAYLAARPAAASLPRNGRVLASPKARRLAQERGLDLGALAGSGPEGAVLAADVLAAQPPASQPPASQPSGSQRPASNLQPLATGRLWRVMAERVTQAWTTIPHFYLLREVDAARLLAWRDEARQRAAEKITVTDLLIKLTAAALRRHPRLNASWHPGGIALNAEVNIGLAVAVDDGLFVPVIHQADALGLAAVAARRAHLVAQAQAGRLGLDELSGGTFTLSNLGMYGVEAFNAIIVPPQAAILAVGAITERVVAVDGQPAVRPRLTLSLSCDHRVVDGARGAQFLQTLAELIEAPLRLLE